MNQDVDHIHLQGRCPYCDKLLDWDHVQSRYEPIDDADLRVIGCYKCGREVHYTVRTRMRYCVTTYKVEHEVATDG